MRIGELARRAALEVSTIRYYEALGLLPRAPRSPSGYRQYRPADLERLDFIRFNRQLGFTLREIKQLLPLHSVVTELAVTTPSGSAELTSIVAMLEDKRQDIETKIIVLRNLRRGLVRAVSRLTTGPVAVCPASLHVPHGRK